MSIKKLLVINPNASPEITELIKSGVDRHLGTDIVPTYWTCPEGPTVLKGQADIDQSTKSCLRYLGPMTPIYDAFLLACYADHPLTSALKVEVGRSNKPVVGVFGASVHAALETLKQKPPTKKFAIMTTGKSFENQLGRGVQRILGPSKNEPRFAGVISTDIIPNDTMPEITVTARQKVQNAVQRIIGDDEILVICVGGVILYGLEDCVLQSFHQTDHRTQEIVIIDQLKAGVDVIKRELKNQQ